MGHSNATYQVQFESESLSDAKTPQLFITPRQRFGLNITAFSARLQVKQQKKKPTGALLDNAAQTKAEPQ